MTDSVPEHIYSSASESGYEPINQGGHLKQTDDDDGMLDNMAYGEVEVEPNGTQLESQHNTPVTLNVNESYSAVPFTHTPGDGEYAYTTMPCSGRPTPT